MKAYLTEQSKDVKEVEVDEKAMLEYLRQLACFLLSLREEKKDVRRKDEKRTRKSK